MKLETITEVITQLLAVVAEPTPAFRRAKLLQYLWRLERQRPCEEDDLLSLVLSFQLGELFDIPFNPRFNTIEYEDFEAHITEWNNSNQTLLDFLTLPYVIQTILVFMTNPTSLKLSAAKIAELPIKYIDPYDWLLQLVIAPVEMHEGCHFCGGAVRGADLCVTCAAQFGLWTAYRCEDFVIELTHKQCTWTPLPRIDRGDFVFDYHNFHIQRTGLHEISYTVIVNLSEPYQQQLPFVEYRR